MATEYELKPEILSLCKPIWNPITKKFDTNDIVGIRQCCQQANSHKIKYCFEQCKSTYGVSSPNPHGKNYNKCISQCYDVIRSINATCLEYDSKLFQHLLSCIKEKGCGTYPNLNKECLEKNRLDLLECCRTNCVKDCNCSQMLSALINDKGDFLTKMKNNTRKSSNYSSKPFNHLKYILLILGIIIIVILVLFYYK